MNEPYPSTENLLATVRSFLEELRPTLTGEQRYHAQVAGYLLDILQRECRAPTEPSALKATLGLDARTFRTSLRSGALEGRDAELAAILLEDLAREVAVVRPDQLAPEHRHLLR